jgi:putative nucleotidyltransferase with HDIG domain
MDTTKVNKNFELYLNRLEYCTKRDTTDLIKYIGSTDMIGAPASSKFHLNIMGGLVQHSINVDNFAIQIHDMLNLGLSLESIHIAALLHDICKVNTYVQTEKWDGEHKEKTGEWRKIPGYTVDDREPLGHGEKSVIVVSRYFKLTLEEEMAIRWHMGFSDPGTHFYYPTGDAFKKALAIHPLAKVIMIADQMAECYETK